jgi:hypothetical protein
MSPPATPNEELFLTSSTEPEPPLEIDTYGFFATYRAARSHGSITGSHDAVRALKCATSALAASSALSEGANLASRLTRRSCE